MLRQYLRHNRGLPWLQFPVTLTFLIAIIPGLFSGYLSLAILDTLVVAILLNTMLEILYRKTNSVFFGLLVVIMDVGVLTCASLSFNLMPLGEMIDPFNILLITYIAFHFLRRFGLADRFLCLTDILVFTRALPKSFGPVFNFEFDILAVVICVYMCQNLPWKIKRAGAVSVEVVGAILLFLTPVYFNLTLWDYPGMSLSMVLYTLIGLWILTILAGHNLQRFFSSTPFMLSITGGDMVGAAIDVQPQDRGRGTDLIVNTRPLVGIDTPWVILDDNNDEDQSSSSGSDSDDSPMGAAAVIRTIRNRRLTRNPGDPVPLPPSPTEVALAEAIRRGARGYEVGDPPTTPVSNMDEVTAGYSFLPPFRWGEPTGNLPESGIPSAGMDRLQRLMRVADGRERTGRDEARNFTLNLDEFFARLSPTTTRAGTASQPVTQQGLRRGSASARSESEETDGDSRESPEIDPSYIRRLPVFPPGRRIRPPSSSGSSSPSWISEPDSESGPVEQQQPLPRPATPPVVITPQPYRVHFAAQNDEGQPRPRRRGLSGTRFTRQGRALPPPIFRTGTEDSVASQPNPSSGIPTIVLSSTDAATTDVTDSNNPRPPSSRNRGHLNLPIVVRPGTHRSPLLSHTFVDPDQRGPDSVIQLIGEEEETVTVSLPPLPLIPTPTTTTTAPAAPTASTDLADSLTLENSGPRTPGDWEIISIPIPPGPTDQQTRRTRARRARSRASTQGPDNTTTVATTAAEGATGPSTTIPYPENETLGELEHREISEALLHLEYESSGGSVSSEVNQRITGLAIPRQHRRWRRGTSAAAATTLPPTPTTPPSSQQQRRGRGAGRAPQGDGGNGGGGGTQVQMTLQEIRSMEEAMASSMTSDLVRFFAQGQDSQLEEVTTVEPAASRPGAGGTPLEIAMREYLVEMEQRNNSLPLFRQRGGSGGESSAYGGVMGMEGLSQVSVLEAGDEEEFEEVPYTGKGKGRAVSRRRR
ncbi:hypothetical protein L873DRAFT_231274 [Choiromyces venosus 120613-1]|uniref:Uncharacterized protein n=1 Tax=Choiromyces venosus 120613-1 TaxID=1336337 RepID=A0A3N4K1T5_9PEZI|nr:hypothetical protein L873DRAFT_231274 [Choiromyces venosus 120613-1]